MGNLLRTAMIRAKIVMVPIGLLLSILQLSWAAESSGLPRENSDQSDILPLSLGMPSECFDSSSPYALNNGTYPNDLVVVGAANCENSTYLPHTWKNGSWSLVELPVERAAYVQSISDTTATGPAYTIQTLRDITPNTLLYTRAWVAGAGRPMQELQPLAGMKHIDRAVISADGNHIVGSNSNGANPEKAVRWTRNGANWSSPQEIGLGEAVATSEDGSLVIGNYGGQPWVWTANQGGGGSITQLDMGAWAWDVTHTGSMIVGFHNADCPNKPPGCRYQVPLYWVLKGGQWRMHELQALDGVDSEAKAVAEVNGQPIITGYGYLIQDGGILSPVVWIPAADGSYGAPLRLPAIGGYFDSWAEAVDVNRNGLVLGTSDAFHWDPEGPFPPTVAVLWNLFGDFEKFQINPGLNDAWYNPATPGQGFFINVFPDIGRVFLAWFSYDTERPDGSVSATIGEPGHRWLTAFGPYADGQAVLDIEISQGGIFNSAEPAPIQGPDGSITLEFSSCNAGTVTYDITSIGKHGVIPIERITLDNVPACEELDGLTGTGPTTTIESENKVKNGSQVAGFQINRGLNDAWYNPTTNGQGFFMNVFPEIGHMFLGWFTYDTERPAGSVAANLGDPGHRWITAYGPYTGDQAVLDIEISEGGVFDSVAPASTQRSDGMVTVDMSDCENGTVTYDITSANLQGQIPIERISKDNVPLCETLASQVQQVPSSH